jgi:hypothetical protein
MRQQSSGIGLAWNRGPTATACRKRKAAGCHWRHGLKQLGGPPVALYAVDPFLGATPTALRGRANSFDVRYKCNNINARVLNQGKLEHEPPAASSKANPSY